MGPFLLRDGPMFVFPVSSPPGSIEVVERARSHPRRRICQR
ncbi:hypothetical protein HMPREF9621_00139 [Cutibacterium modestum HL037PA2]|uniref:Uncharacterized protein n=1 Tax=Cutibacterium modestum HL044PA1 TaxID=765109 RepID=A0ABP2K3K1_9ACTN|nr:hypothetical protein HMPREF9621_00139 [Cutibacterium modestum HL037PA2]EFS91368.1 hypothetical protein HMPREF9607_02661 [Cutibacterium modestum HL044PA1]